MLLHVILPLACLPLSLHAAETVLGVYIFSRHGDRTAKSTPPTNLTDLGYRQIFDSGTYFRNRYVSSSASSRVAGLNSDLVGLSQITASAPLDNVLMNSAQAFLQGIYPPVGRELGQEMLRNDTVVQAPLDGYQLIPIQTVSSGTGSEDTAWLQGASNCANAIVSSNDYFSSPEHIRLSESTQAFYGGLVPTVNATFSETEISFKNAYAIYDILNVALLHNRTIPSSTLLTNDALLQLRTLADTHEYGLAYSVSDSIRAVAGATLAAEILQALNSSITNPSKAPKLNIQFGAYASFLSFFGLAKLPSVSSNFMGVPDYASTMTFELFTNAAPTPFPPTDQLQVRFLFHNGTTSNISEPIAYPLFGARSPEMSWSDFAAGMNAFAIGDQEHWCKACGNSTGVCASKQPASTVSSNTESRDQDVSRAVAGVIGAMVTLAVVLGLEALVILVAGLKLVKRRSPKNMDGANLAAAKA